MEVSVDRDAFLKGLQMVHNVVEPRQTLPILANVLLESDGDTLRLTATDLEVGARVSVPAKVLTGGSVTLSARKLLEIVKVDESAIQKDFDKLGITDYAEMTKEQIETRIASLKKKLST